MSPMMKEEELYEIDELTEIHAAIINDDLEQLEDICQDNVNLDEKFSDEIDNDHVDMTPLALAAALNRLNQVEVLLRYGANVNACFASLQTTALMTSSFHGHVEVVKCLLKHGANVQATDVQGSTALGYCFGGSKSMQVVELLLGAGIDVNARNMLGMNALLLVSGYCHGDLVRAMLAAHAQSNVTNNYRHSPLHLAVFGKRSKIMKITDGGLTQLYGLHQTNLRDKLKSWVRENPSKFESVDLGKKDGWVNELGVLMEEIGARIEHVEEDVSITSVQDEDVIRRGLDAANRYRKEKILKRDAGSKKSDILKTILSCGGRRGGGQQAVASASEAPMARPYQPSEPDLRVEELVLDVIDETRDVVSMLIDAGCPLDLEEKAFGLTALDVAILCGDIHSAALLTHALAHHQHIFKLLSLQDLYECVSASGRSRQLKELLACDPHVDVNASFLPSHTQKRSAEDEEEELTSDALLTPVAVAAKAQDNSTVDVIKLLLKHGADINKVGLGGRTALCEACRWCNAKMVEFLLNQGADMETPSPAFNQATPLVVAVMHQQHATAQLLISRGAFVDAAMSDGRTSLIAAMDNEDLAMVEALLQANPHLNFANQHDLPCLLATAYHTPNRDMKAILAQISRVAEEIRLKEDAALRDSDLYTTLPNPASSVQPQAPNPEKPPSRSDQPPQRASIPIRAPTPTSDSTASPERPVPPHRPNRKKKKSLLTESSKNELMGHEHINADGPAHAALPNSKKKKKQKSVVADADTEIVVASELLQEDGETIHDLKLTKLKQQDKSNVDSIIAQPAVNKLNETFEVVRENQDPARHKTKKKNPKRKKTMKFYSSNFHLFNRFKLIDITI